MIQTSENYKEHFKQGSIQEYKIEIDGVEYSDVFYDTPSLSQRLFDKPTLSFGGFVINQLLVKLKIPTKDIAKGAGLKFFYRYVGELSDGSNVPSEWIQKFDGHVYERTEYTKSVTSIKAFDKASNYDIFLEVFGTQIPSYPANTRTVVGLCASHLGLVVDNIAAVYNGDVVEYPNEMSIIQVLQNIAKMSGGNWTITEDGKLRLIVLKNLNLIKDDFSDFIAYQGAIVTRNKTFPIDVFKGGRNLLNWTDFRNKPVGRAYVNYWVSSDKTKTLPAGSYKLKIGKVIVKNGSPISQLLRVILVDDRDYSILDLGANRIDPVTLEVQLTSDIPFNGFRLYGGTLASQSEPRDVDFIELKLEHGTVATPWSPAPEDGYGLDLPNGAYHIETSGGTNLVKYYHSGQVRQGIFSMGLNVKNFSNKAMQVYSVTGAFTYVLPLEHKIDTITFDNTIQRVDYRFNASNVSDPLDIIASDPVIMHGIPEYDAQSYTSSSLISPISKVTVYWDDESAFSVGEDGGSEVVMNNPWATQANTEYLYNLLKGYVYTPLIGTKVYADPAIQLGDAYSHDGMIQVVAEAEWKFDGSATADIETPQNNDSNLDDPITFLQQQEFKKKVSLGDSYQGTTISRDKGIQMLLSPDGNEKNAIGKFYADINKGIAFQTRTSPLLPWQDWLYFDIPEGKFKLAAYSTTEEVGDMIDGIQLNKVFNAWSPNENGDPLSLSPQPNSRYWGTYSGTFRPTTPSMYDWALIRGADGNGVKSTAIDYQLSTSGTTIPTGSWSTSIPTPIKGRYLWTRTRTTYTDNSVVPTYSVSYLATDGTNGIGVKSTVVNYATSTSGTVPPTAGWSTTIPSVAKGSYLWTRTVITLTNDVANTGYSVSYEGLDGSKGDKGDTGNGITSTVIAYATSPSGTTPPTNWTSTIPTVPKGQYLWTRTTISYTTGTPSVSYSTAYEGRDGVNGDNGNGIANADVKYQLSTSGTTAPTGTWSSSPPAPVTGQYLWTRTILTFTDGTDSMSYSTSYFAKDGVGIQSTEIRYQQSTSGTVPPTGAWTTGIPVLVQGQFLWTRTQITLTNQEIKNSYAVSFTPLDANGIKLTQTDYALSTSGTVPPSSWSASIPNPIQGQYSWTRVRLTLDDDTIQTSYSVAYNATNGDSLFIAYADTDTGGGFSLTDDRKDFIGMYSGQKPQSLTPSDYDWSPSGYRNSKAITAVSLELDVVKGSVTTLVERTDNIDDRTSELEVSVEGIDLEFKQVHNGQLLKNANGKDGYFGWNGGSNMLYVNDLVYAEPIRYDMGFIPKIMEGSLSEYGLSFYSIGTVTSDKVYIVPNTDHSIKMRSMNVNTNFTVSILEFRNFEDTIPLRITSTWVSYFFVEKTITPNPQTNYLAVRITTNTGVTPSNRVELTEIMLNRGQPKDWFESPRDAISYADANIQLLQDGINLNTSMVDQINGAINNTTLKITANEGIDIRSTGGVGLRIRDEHGQDMVTLGTDGAIHARDGVFENATITGNLAAGTIAGLTFDSSAIIFPDGNLKLDSANNAIEFGSFHMKHGLFNDQGGELSIDGMKFAQAGYTGNSGIYVRGNDATLITDVILTKVIGDQFGSGPLINNATYPFGLNDAPVRLYMDANGWIKGTPA